MLVDRGDPSGGGEAPEASDRPGVAAVVVAYGDEPWLERGVEALLASTGVDVSVVVVDNGCTDGTVDRLRGRPGVTVVDPEGNLGFAAGCNAGVAASAPGAQPYVALVNPDTEASPEALARMVDALSEPEVGIATCSLRLADRPELLNSAGNEMHFLGLSWSGSFEVPASQRARRRDVLAASGAGMVVRRELWDEFGGFVPEFFAYQEDAELSVRCWLSGRRVVYVPDAMIVHRYEFSRTPGKFFLLDRNRLLLVLTVYELRTLVLLAPGLVVQELLMFAVAAVQGWMPERLRSVSWLLRNSRFIAARRRTVATTRRRGDAVIAPLLAEVVQPGNHPLPSWAVALQWPLVLWWRIVRRSLR